MGSSRAGGIGRASTDESRLAAAAASSFLGSTDLLCGGTDHFPARDSDLVLAQRRSPAHDAAVRHAACACSSARTTARPRSNAAAAGTGASGGSASGCADACGAAGENTADVGGGGASTEDGAARTSRCHARGPVVRRVVCLGQTRWGASERLSRRRARRVCRASERQRRRDRSAVGDRRDEPAARKRRL